MKFFSRFSCFLIKKLQKYLFSFLFEKTICLQIKVIADFLRTYSYFVSSFLQQLQLHPQSPDLTGFSAYTVML